MDLTNHMRCFFEIMKNDPTLKPRHISLLVVLYGIWNKRSRPTGPFPINRKEIMKWARIGNGGTYDKCLSALNGRYFFYKKGNRSVRGKSPEPALISIIYLGKWRKVGANTGNGAMSQMNCSSVKIGTAPIAEVEPSLKVKSLKVLNSKNKQFKNYDGEEEIEFLAPDSELTPPTQTEVELEFEKRGYSIEEAVKFYRWHSKNGWYTGKNTVKNWKRMIDGWIRNNKQTKSNSSTNNDPRIVIQRIYQKFLDGVDVEGEIRIDYYKTLNLPINGKSIEEAKKIRIHQLEASNESRDKRILSAYENMTGESKDMVERDFEVVKKIAARLTVMDYFRDCQGKGIENLF